MRKVLLASTALVALGSVSAMAADVSISGSYEMLYKSIDDNGVTTDQDSISSSSELDISFSETLDNGMTMSMGFGFGGAKDDSNFTLSGTPMGTLSITDMDDGAVAGLDVDVDGYTPEEGRTGTPEYAGGFTGVGGDSKVSLTLPPMMAGLTVAVAMSDSTDDAKDTAYGLSYAGTAEGMSFKVALAANTSDNGTVETDYSHYGLEITAGAFTIGGAINGKEVDSDSADYESSEIGAKYAVNSALTLGAFSRTAETGTASEEFKETAMSATYTIAPGLSASITSTSSDISSTDEDSRMVIGLNASF